MNLETLNYINIVFGLGAIALQVVSIVALCLLAFKKENLLLDFIKQKQLVLGFLITLCATLASLFYSNIVGFLPCVLCWYQRIFIFPLVLIFGIALYKKDNGVIKYVTSLAVVGFLISLYQNFFYYFGGSANNLPCDASGVSCYKRVISEFGGYVSFPMFSLTVFLAVLTIASVVFLYKKDVHQG